MLSSSDLRLRRKVRQRFKMRQISAQGKGRGLRLCVHRTGQHMYAQIIDDVRGETIASSSTLMKEARLSLRRGSNTKAAFWVGRAIAKVALEKGIQDVVFDRSGFLYHGRVKALADGAREAGLKF